MKKITKSIMAAALAAATLTGCTSYEIDMPENPAEPTVGTELSADILYQANPRFFASNDCLEALRAQLPRISGMGCNVLWVMPVYETGQLNAFGSPYCVRDFKALNPRYGTMEQARALVNDAHAAGMKVIFDWVANHTAWDCAWITEHPDWYVHDEAGNIVSPQGWTDVAQLNFDNAAMRAAMKDAILYWVDALGIDGYRYDYVNGVPGDFWQDVNAAIKAKNPDAILLAETEKTQYYEDGFGMIYDWKSATTIAGAFTGGKPADVCTEAADAWAGVPEGKSILRYVFNHDVAAENNVATMFGSSEAIPAAYVLASMVKGTPMIYSSMDVEGLSGTLSFFNYTPLTFSQTLSDRFKAINAAFAATLEVRRGEMTDYSDKSVACYTYAVPGHTLLVAVNCTGAEQTVRTPIQLTGSTMQNLLNGATETVPVMLTLPAYGYAIMMN